MPFAEVPGASLYYEIHGEGPWLVFVHGAGGSHLSWWQQVPALEGRFRCLIYDQRGWGQSSCEAPPDPGSFASDLSALLNHVGADTAALVGQSMGGWSVMGCALSDPKRISHLVLTGTLAGLTDDAMIQQLIARQPADSSFQERRALAPDFPARDPARTFLYEQIAALNRPPTPEFLVALVGLRYEQAAQKLRMPVCFISGGRDQLFPLDIVRQAHAKLPQAEMVIVPDAGHSVYFERPDDFNRALLSFLSQE